MRKKIVAGNWKMNLDKSSSDNLVKEILDLTKENKTLLQQNKDLQNAINNSTYLSDKVKTI